MIKRGSLVSIFAFAVLFSLAFASATIEITQQPFEVYNFGDTVFTSVSLNPSNVTGSFEINLVCDGNSVNFYKIAPAESAFSPNVPQKINHKIILTKEYLGSLIGDCYIQSFLGSESVNSNHFLLTEDISLTTKIDKALYSPGETVSISMEAKKANGISLNGHYQLSSSANLNGNVEEGIATALYQIANDAPAGKYEVVVWVYDGEINNILNQKKYALYYEVKQVPRKLEIGLGSFEATPNQNFSFSVDLTDQIGLKMPGSVSVKYTSPKNEQNNLDILSGTTGTIDFPSDATPGSYLLTATIGDLSVEKEFTVKEVANISVVLLEDLKMVSVTNIGNVPYSDSLNVTIGNETETILVDLKLGEEKRYNLHAPDGIYDVLAQTGVFSAASQLSLTGHAVSVGSWTGVGLFEQYPLVWFFIALILIVAGIIVFMKFRNNRTYDYKARSHERAQKEMKDEDLNEISKKAFQKKQFLNLANPIVNEAQSVPTLKGNKDNCSVIAVNIKNYAHLGVEARSRLNEIISTAKDKYGVLEFRGQHMLIIYSPLVTRTYKNEIIASKAAWKIRNELDKYNSKFKDKIVYNIGLNAGEMVSALVNGKLAYTNIGNGVVLAKRISDLSEGKILVSQSFRQKLMRELKIAKTDFHIGNSEIMEVIAMADIDRNQDKLTDIMKRSNFMRTE